MMAKPALVSYEVVAQAADELERAGLVPSQSKLVEKIGGSNSTVGPLLRRWKAERDAKRAATVANDMPRNIEVDLAVASVVRRAEAAIRDELRDDLGYQAKEIEELTTERDTEKARGAELATEVAALTRTRDELNGQLGQLHRETESARTERARLESELGEARQALGKSQERIQGLEVRVNELSVVEASMKAEVAALKTRTETAEAGRADAEHRRTTAVSELEAKLGIEHQARGDAESRVVDLLRTIDAHGPKLERLGAAEASVKLLQDQVDTLKRMLELAEERAKRPSIIPQPMPGA